MAGAVGHAYFRPMSQPTSTNRRVEVAIIGAGMSGICMAIKLREAGIDSFTVFEKAHDVGGTWRDNRYPGLTCDVPSPFYSYSFALNPEWSSRFAPGPEIHRYFKSTAERYDVLRHVRCGTEIVEASFDGDRWQLRSAAGDMFAADVVVAATGLLHHPRIPELAGLGAFGGDVFHSSHWDQRTRVDGRRVGVVGTGSTGVQLVTELAKRTASLTQFQRSAQWIFRQPNWTYSRPCRALLRRSKRLTELLYRLHAGLFGLAGRATIEPGWERRLMNAGCRWNLRSVRDPQLRARLTPDYEPLCRRLVFSPGYYQAVQRANVEVVDTAIDHVEARGVVTADGRLHELDVLVLATGFDSHAYMRPMAVVGRDGVTLADMWAEGPQAHRTVALPDFPNFFMLMGPNSPIHTSLVPVAESQAGFVMHWVHRMLAGEVRHVAPKPEATAAFNTWVRQNMGDTTFVTGCSSWYIGPDGYPVIWPFSAEAFHTMLAAPDDAEYEVLVPPPVPVAA